MRLVKPNTTMMEFKEKPMDKTPTRSIKSLILPVKLPVTGQLNEGWVYSSIH